MPFAYFENRHSYTSSTVHSSQSTCTRLPYWWNLSISIYSMIYFVVLLMYSTRIPAAEYSYTVYNIELYYNSKHINKYLFSSESRESHHFVFISVNRIFASIVFNGPSIHCHSTQIWLFCISIHCCFLYSFGSLCICTLCTLSVCLFRIIVPTGLFSAYMKPCTLIHSHNPL